MVVFVVVSDVLAVEADDCETEDELKEAEGGVEDCDYSCALAWGGGVGGILHVCAWGDALGVSGHWVGFWVGTVVWVWDLGLGLVFLGLVLFDFFEAGLEELCCDEHDEDVSMFPGVLSCGWCGCR